MKFYFEIGELEKWLSFNIDIIKYKIINCYNNLVIETEKNSKYWIEIHATGKIELKSNSYRKEDNSYHLLNELINNLLDQNLLIFWDENQGYLLKDKNNLSDLVNVLFQTNIDLKKEIENLKEEVQELKYKSDLVYSSENYY